MKKTAQAGQQMTQIEKFKQAARESEAEESEEAFNRVLEKVAKSPPIDKRAPKVRSRK